MVALLFAAIGGYLLGSVPFGLVLTRLAGLGDIRAIGSGNIGATNVLRTGRKGLALATLLLDGGKGAIAVGLAWALLGAETIPLAGFAAVLGHNFPVWLGFKGGKGVATTIGTLLAACWPVGLACIGTWLVTAAVFRISSLAALVALAASPGFALYFAGPQYALMAAGLAVMGIYRHKANIIRLIRGEEPRIGAKKKAERGAAHRGEEEGRGGSVTPPVVGSLLRDLPDAFDDEVFDTLAQGREFRLLRIVSNGQATPPDQWLDQDDDEWVLVVSGAAVISIEGEARTHALTPGGWLLLPAHCRHRVEWTDPDQPTVWLALHFSS